ncbi:acyltransferase family protein [Demequina salsinemoris]|uniref:acyltransferase family protein n=1 Tax=Demequina salsinemoris TaxID=577470 RepID=UPI0007863ABE|nr:acyltransferase family protein [Demequina salsinemoris]
MGRRLDWADTVKGAAIVLVVVFHSAIWSVNAGYAPAWWDQVTPILETVLMPPFFLVSGLFAGRWLTRPLPELLKVKVWPLMWVFMVWSALMLLILPLEARLDGMEREPLKNFLQFFLSPVRPRFEMWFLWTLAVFYIGMWITRRMPVILQLSLATVASIAAFALPAIHEYNVGYSGALKFYVYFLVGLHLRDHVVRFMGAVRWPVALAYVGVWGLLVVGFVASGMDGRPVAFAAMAALGTMLTLALGVLLAPVERVRVLGTQTLPIYVTHVPIVVVTLTVLVGVGVPGSADSILGGLVPIVVAAWAIAVALVVSRAVAGNVGRYLYEAPPFPERPRLGASRAGRRAG